jgi:hypothetical protein
MVNPEPGAFRPFDKSAAQGGK